jgi:O-antigen/teichoic acid export membrane protein
LLVIPISTVVTLGAYIAVSRFGPAFYSDAVVQGFQDVCIALVLFAINKVIVSILNGLRMMRAFAVAQAARPVLLATGALLAAAHGTEPEHLPRIILWTEVAMFTALGAWLVGSSLLGRTTEAKLWARSQLAFGAKAFVGGGLSEANTRVDILIAGSVLSDREVGIYSLAAMIVEGLVQLPSVIRNTINPVLARMAAVHDFDGLCALCLRAARSTYAIMFAVIALVLALYPWGVDLVIGKAEFQESWPVLIAACCGVLIASGALPLEMILLQLGLPSLHTAFKASVLIANIACTAILINALGLIGAGVASGLNFVFSAILLLGCTRLALRHLRRHPATSVMS